MLSKKKLFLFDIDGTIGVGDILFEGSKELFSYIDKIGGKACFITNNSTKSRKAYVEKFLTWGIKTVEDQFITSGYVTIEYLKTYFKQEKIFVLGTKSWIEELRQNGLWITEDKEEGIRCVVVAFDNELNYKKLEKVSEILMNQDITYLATNPDLRCPASFGFIPDCGAICHMIEDTVDRVPLYLGKPSRTMVDMCLEKTGFKKEDVLVVGDRLYTDIACGIAGETQTCVVFTGEAKREDLEHTFFIPTYAFENIKELFDHIIKETIRKKGEGYMQIDFTKNEIEVMKKAGVDFNVFGELDSDTIFEIDNLVAEYLIYEGIDEAGNENEEGHLCRDILEKLSEE